MTLKSRIEEIIEAKHAEIFTPIITAAITDAIDNEEDRDTAISEQLEAMAVNWALVKQIYGALDSPIGSPEYNVTSIDFNDSPYDLLETDYLVECDCTLGTVVVNFPAVIQGKKYFIKKMDSGVNAVTLGAIIEGLVTPSLAAQYDSAQVIGGSSQWLNVP